MSSRTVVIIAVAFAGLLLTANHPATAQTPGDACEDALVVTDGTYSFSTIGATTDGPNPTECDTGTQNIESDIWFMYQAECSGGRGVLRTCAETDFDAIVAAYRLPSGSTECICPTDTSTQHDLCLGDTCPPPPGILDPIEDEPIEYGDCLAIRVGGKNGSQGTGTIYFGCLHVDCLIARPPALEPTVPDMGCGTRNRYLGFEISDYPAEDYKAIRVTFANLPPPHDYSNGRQAWVGPPVQVSESSSEPGTGSGPEFWLSELQCTPYYTRWSDFGAVYVAGEDILPGATYVLQAIRRFCRSYREGDYSDPLEIQTTGWGDVAKDCGTEPCGSPDCDVDFDDISAMIEKFRNLPGAIQKSRADIAPSTPDQTIDFTDIPAVVDAFRGLPYPYFGPPVIDPCGP